MRRLTSFSNRCAYGVAFGLLLLTCPILGQDRDPISLLPEDAVAAFIASPQKVWADPALDFFPREVVTAAGLRELGFDPMKIEQAFGFVTAPSASGPPGFALFLRFTEPVNSDSLLPNLTRGATRELLRGKPFYRAAQPMIPSVYLPNPRSVVVAPNQVLQKMLESQPATSRLATMLRTSAEKHHVTLAADLEPIRDLIDAQLAQAPPVPPPFQPFLKIPQLVSFMEVQLDYGTRTRTQLTLYSSNENAAIELEQLLLAAIGMAKQQFIAAIERESQPDEIQQAMVQYMRRIADKLGAMVAPRRDGPKVAVVIESDVSAASLGVMAALLLPAVQSAREAARRMSSSNNLKQIALAMHNYHDVYRHFPARANFDENGKPLLSWRVHLLPFLENQALYNEFHLDEPWDSEHNRKLIARMPDVYRSPNNPQAEEGKTNYVVVTGEGTAFDGTEGKSFRDILDGTSNTIMTLEVNNEHAVIWTKPDDWEFDPKDPFRGLLGLRPNGFNAGFMDGSVRFISEAIDPDMLRALFTIRGGEVVRDF